MTSLDKIDYLMQKALDKCTSDKLRSVVNTLREMLPETLAAIQSVAVSPESSPSQKLKAGEMILGIHARVIAADNEYQRTEAIKAKSRAVSEAARAERLRVKLDAKKVLLEEARTRRKYSRVLEKAEEAAKQMEKETQ
jgi:hypothetical protein